MSFKILQMVPKCHAPHRGSWLQTRSSPSAAPGTPSLWFRQWHEATPEKLQAFTSRPKIFLKSMAQLLEKLRCWKLCFFKALKHFTNSTSLNLFMSCFSPSCVKTHKAANSVACTQKRPLLLSLGSGSFQATWNSSLCWPEEKPLFRLETKICHPNYSIRSCYRYNFSAFNSTFPAMT